MQLRIEQIYWLKLDTEEAEQFLENPSDAQAKIRAALEANHKQTNAPSRAPMAHVTDAVSLGNGNGTRARPKARKGDKKRKTMEKTECPECGRELAKHFLGRHRETAHGVAVHVDLTHHLTGVADEHDEFGTCRQRESGALARFVDATIERALERLRETAKDADAGDELAKDGDF